MVMTDNLHFPKSPEVCAVTEWANHKTLAEAIGVSRATFYRKVQAGHIQSTQVAGRRLYRAVIAPIQQHHGVVAAPDPNPSVRQLQTELADLRANHARVWKELHYRRAVAPDGMRFVEGFFSGDAYRTTPNRHLLCSYLNGSKAYRVIDSHTGPSGFVVVCEDGDTSDRKMTVGVVHVLAKDEDDETPFPKQLNLLP